MRHNRTPVSVEHPCFYLKRFLWSAPLRRLFGFTRFYDYHQLHFEKFWLLQVYGMIWEILIHGTYMGQEWVEKLFLFSSCVEGSSLDVFTHQLLTWHNSYSCVANRCGYRCSLMFVCWDGYVATSEASQMVPVHAHFFPLHKLIQKLFHLAAHTGKKNKLKSERVTRWRNF